MAVSRWSIFERTLNRQMFTDGVWLGRGWYEQSRVKWSYATAAAIFLEPAFFGDARWVGIRYRVFNASIDVPKTVVFDSDWAKPVSVSVKDAGWQEVFIPAPKESLSADAELKIIVDGLESPWSSQFSEDERILGIHLGAVIPSAQVRDLPFSFASGGDCEDMLRSGWDTPGKEGAWSLGDRARISIPGNVKVDGNHLEILGRVIPRPASFEPLVVQIGINGELCFELTGEAQLSQAILCPLPIDWVSGQTIEIEFLFRNVLTPFEIGYNSDRRPISFQILEIKS